MAYDKSKEQVIKTWELVDDVDAEKKAGTIFELFTNDGKYPQLRINRYFTTKDDEKKVVPFVNIPAKHIKKITEYMNKIAEVMDKKFNQQQESD